MGRSQSFSCKWYPIQRLCQSPCGVPKSLVPKQPHYNRTQGWVYVQTNMVEFKATNAAKNENKWSTNARTHFHCKNNRDGEAFGSRFTNELREEISNYTRLDRDGAEHVSTWLVCFLEDEHLSSLAVHPSVHRFPEAPGGREGSVMNERRWRTPKAMISDPPPTSQHRQKDNEREKNKKKTEICHIPGLKTGMGV